MKKSLAHRLRWERSSRMSRPAGYVGQVFTHSLVLGILACALAPQVNLWILALVAICVGLRALVAWQGGWVLLRDPEIRKRWWLLPVSDLLSFGIWCWAFAGSEIQWRGERFTVLRGGKLVSKDSSVKDRTPVGVGR